MIPQIARRYIAHGYSEFITDATYGEPVGKRPAARKTEVRVQAGTGQHLPEGTPRPAMSSPLAGGGGPDGLDRGKAQAGTVKPSKLDPVV